MSATPGARTPGEAQRTTETVSGTVDSSGTNSSLLGEVVGDQWTIKEVRVKTTDTGFDFNVEANGSDVFSGEQSPTASPERFSPDQNKTGGGGVDLAVDVSSAGTDTAAQVAVVVEYNAE